MRESTSKVRVRYAETDQMGVAWHGNYLAWFEVARTDLLRGLGVSYRELEERGLRLPVVAASARFLRPARYDDVLDVHAKLVSLGGARLTFEYEVRLEGKPERMAEGTTTHAVVDPSSRPRRIPGELRSLLA
jgi:acyl-CoA thioester hydrolase